MTVTEALDHELEEMPSRARASTAAAQARAMALILDDPRVSGAQKALCNRELRETMAALRALAPPKRDKDPVDELTERRSARLSASAGSARP